MTLVAQRPLAWVGRAAICECGGNAKGQRCDEEDCKKLGHDGLRGDYDLGTTRRAALDHCPTPALTHPAVRLAKRLYKKPRAEQGLKRGAMEARCDGEGSGPEMILARIATAGTHSNAMLARWFRAIG